ncbi:MAG: peptidase, partial [Proteobacteria bacterium]
MTKTKAPVKKAVSKGLSKSKSRATKKSTPEKEFIVVDEAAGLIFENEADLFGYFADSIQALEDEYQALRSEEDYNDEEQLDLGNYLETTLDEPDEVWQDTETFEDMEIHHFIRTFDVGGVVFHYIAVAYVTPDDSYPSFVFIHFPTKDSRLQQNYQRGEIIFDKKYEYVRDGAIEGDALGEGDPLSMGLYTAMMKVRGEKDIVQEKFQEYSELREDTIESADEIWRKNDMDGNILVTFIREYPDHDTKDLSYVVVTQEDSTTNVKTTCVSRTSKCKFWNTPKRP